MITNTTITEAEVIMAVLIDVVTMTIVVVVDTLGVHQKIIKMEMDQVLIAAVAEEAVIIKEMVTIFIIEIIEVIMIAMIFVIIVVVEMIVVIIIIVIAKDSAEVFEAIIVAAKAVECIVIILGYVYVFYFYVPYLVVFFK